MFENMNPLSKSTAWIEIFLLMFGAFLIGYFFARWYYTRKMENRLAESEEEMRLLKLQNLEHANSTYPGGIKAIKTRERKGELAEPKKEVASINTDNTILNFEGFGKATEDDKDDLKLITGVGPFIEKKLNGIGIYTFSQISKFKAQDIEDVTELIKFFPGRIERDKWVDQAKKLLKQ